MAREVSLVQTGVTACLQVATLLIIGGLVALTREIAVDLDIRHRQLLLRGAARDISDPTTHLSPYTRSLTSSTHGVVWRIFLPFGQLALFSLSFQTNGLTGFKKHSTLSWMLHNPASQQWIHLR
jgi:hypothetical protein